MKTSKLLPRRGNNNYAIGEKISAHGFNALLRRIKRILGFRRPREFFKGKKVLDVGCGNGSDLIRFQRLGAEAFGIDKRRPTKRPNIIRGNATRLPFPDNAYNLVFSKFLLDLLDEQEIALFTKESFRVLKSGGLLLQSCLLDRAIIQGLISTATKAGFETVYHDRSTYIFKKPAQ